MRLPWAELVLSGWPVFASMSRLRACVGSTLASVLRKQLCTGKQMCALARPSDLDLLCCCADALETITANLAQVRRVCGIQRRLASALLENRFVPPTEIATLLNGVDEDDFRSQVAKEAGQRWGPLRGLGAATLVISLFDALRGASQDVGAFPLGRSQSVAEVAGIAQELLLRFLAEATGTIASEILLCEEWCWPLLGMLDRLAQPLAVCVALRNAGSLSADSGTHVRCNESDMPSWIEGAPAGKDLHSVESPWGVWFQLDPGRDISSDGMRTRRQLGRGCPLTVWALLRTLAAQRPGAATVIEVGAAAGECAVLARALLGSGLCALLVEPNPSNAALMRGSFRLNGWLSTNGAAPPLCVDARAAAEAPGRLQLFFPRAAAAFASLDAGRGAAAAASVGVEVDMERLDALVASWALVSLGPLGPPRPSRPIGAARTSTHGDAVANSCFSAGLGAATSTSPWSTRTAQSCECFAARVCCFDAASCRHGP